MTYSPGPGTVLAPGPHELRCRFYAEDINNYFSADLRVSLVVSRGSRSIGL
jgi:hypothetical protein